MRVAHAGRRWGTVLAVTFLASVTATSAWATWSIGGGGRGHAAATSLADGGGVTASVDGTSVTLTWVGTGGAAGSAPATGYRIRRYGAGGAGVDAGPACADVVIGTSCVESGVPSGTWRYAVTPTRDAWSGTEGPWSASVTVGPSEPAPAIAAVTIRKSLGGSSGWIRSTGTFHVYASIAGGSGGLAVVADLSGLGAGPSNALSTSGGPWTIDGITYAWRSAERTAGASLPDVATPYTVSAVDGSGRSASRSASVIVDDVVPAPYDLTTADASRPGTMDAGDRLTVTFTEPIDASSILTGWSGSEIDAVVRVNDGGAGADALTFWDGTNSTQLRLGTISLGRSDYVTSTMTFGASGTRSRVSVSGSTFVVTLGTPSSTGAVVIGATGTGTMRITPFSGMWDRAGNACPTTGVNERGVLDREF